MQEKFFFGTKISEHRWEIFFFLRRYRQNFPSVLYFSHCTVAKGRSILYEVYSYGAPDGAMPAAGRMQGGQHSPADSGTRGAVQPDRPGRGSGSHRYLYPSAYRYPGAYPGTYGCTVPYSRSYGYACSYAGRAFGRPL